MRKSRRQRSKRSRRGQRESGWSKWSMNKSHAIVTVAGIGGWKLITRK